MARLTRYNYVFAIGTFFAMLDAYNNGASEFPLRRSTRFPKL
jgi:sodium-dependent phosphate transporter